MTANAMEGDRQACIDAGMNDYISKPVSVSAISTAIKNWWSQAQI
jgi:CheY-like chemotaxis protein